MKIIFKIIKGLLTAFLLVILTVVILQKVTNNKIALGNIYIFQVVTGSMEPEYKIGDIIVVQKKEVDSLNIGDDVTYLASAQDISGLIITHRIIDKRLENNTYYFTTQGIANTYQDPEITYDNIFGKVVYHTIIFSFVGRLMTNIVMYYILFISVGVGFSYEIISSFFLKDDDEDEE